MAQLRIGFITCSITDLCEVEMQIKKLQYKICSSSNLHCTVSLCYFYKLYMYTIVDVSALIIEHLCDQLSYKTGYAKSVQYSYLKI